MRFSRIILIGIFAVAGLASPSHAYELGTIDIHGFVSQGYLKSTANNFLAETEDGTFEFNEVGVNLSTDLTDKLRMGIQFLARDLGEAGNNEFILDWASVDYKWKDELSVRFGKVKRPMGLYNEGRDVDMLRTWIFLPQSIYSDALRDFQNATEGGGFCGSISAGAFGSFDYQTVIGAQNVDASVTKEAELVTILIPGVDMDDVSLTTQYASDSQIIWNTPLTGLKMGFTWTQSKNELDFVMPYPTTVNIPVDTGMGTINIPMTVTVDVPVTIDADMTKNYVVSAEYHIEGLTLAAEYQEMTLKMDFNSPATPERKTTTQSYYGSAAYRFTDRFEAGTYYSMNYLIKDDKHGDSLQAMGLPDFTGWQKDICGSLRFDINKHWIIKLEGHHMNGTSQVFDSENMDDLKKKWTLFAAKTTVSF